jgi:DNA (cytosine-5)-methyltransferase 1
MSHMQKELIYIDLFAGCGGLSLGLQNAGWKGLFAIEKAEDAFKTLEHNLIDKSNHFSWVDWLPKEKLDVTKVVGTYKKQLKSLRGSVDMVTGGPPCQGFSMAGRRNESDDRNRLVRFYIYFIKLVQPKIIFFENVKGFTLEFKKNGEKGKIYSNFVINKLSKAGYHVHGKLINFADYGIPQKRTRFILVGIRKDIANSSEELAKEFFSKLTANKTSFLESKNLPGTSNLEDAISDLLKEHGTEQSPDTKSFRAGKYSDAVNSYQVLMRQGTNQKVADSHRFVNHSEKLTNRFKYVLENAEPNKDIGSKIRDVLQLKTHTLILSKNDSPCPTLTAHPDDLVHYCEPRILTVREYARIQSFPDNFEFKGKYTTGGLRRRVEVPRYTQVGNAIPPLFGEQSGLVIEQILNER